MYPGLSSGTLDSPRTPWFLLVHPGFSSYTLVSPHAPRILLAHSGFSNVHPGFSSRVLDSPCVPWILLSCPGFSHALDSPRVPWFLLAHPGLSSHTLVSPAAISLETALIVLREGVSLKTLLPKHSSCLKVAEDGSVLGTLPLSALSKLSQGSKQRLHRVHLVMPVMFRMDNHGDPGPKVVDQLPHEPSVQPVLLLINNNM
jgi:hypothetical protein